MGMQNKWAAAAAATVLGVGLIAGGAFAASATGLLPASTITPAVVPSPSPTVESGDDNSVDDPATHDLGDDHGVDGLNHDLNDDHGGDRDRGADDNSGPGNASDGDDDHSGSDHDGSGDDGSGHEGSGSSGRDHAEDGDHQGDDD
jgi:hypothetical protein